MAENTFVCTTDQLYSGPPQAVQQHGGELGIKTHGASNRNMVQSFLKRHLPANRLQAKEDNISFSVVPLVNPVRRKRFNHSRLKRKKLTNRERKETKPFKIPKDNQSYSQQLVLHEAWKQYMEELIPSSRLNSPGEMQAASQKILRAELQGSILTVQRSKCPSLVGVWGIVLQETRHTFVFLTPQDAVKCVPKVNSVFTMEWGGCVFTIHGNHFRVKAAERSSRKFKVKSTTDL
ncbi:ribonuclease P protein subunit p29-like isoform X1 [Babylonia areolata]|uniref:ribonuclease P protein subunit p29-like isoform X1 n=1 Tax=Babylonia areolata TaxID=304850 RepID=UPI003FD19D67